MDISLLLIYMFSVFMLIITPGPVVALVVNTSLACGPKRAMLTALGTNWASLVLVLVAALILTGTLSVSVSMLNWISLVGCFFIAYLSMQALEQALRYAQTPPEAAPAPLPARRSSVCRARSAGFRCTAPDRRSGPAGHETFRQYGQRNPG
ncbi:Efflux protein, LysE family [Pseudomonas savastanoi pv. retacarpa]|nr:Efflux protein, LysE family [Pseudomonas savastanoi pv. retacarpa]